MAQKDAIVFILDVNPSLWETKSTKNSAVTLLDKGIHAITQMIHQKIIDARKTDQLALILFNTDGTDNKLASQASGEYLHVSVVQDFESPKLGTIRYLRDKITLGSGQSQADIMDALIIGADLLMTMTAGKKTFQKKIFLFTDPSVSRPINIQGSDQIVSQMNDHEINLNVILLGDDDQTATIGNEQVLREFCEQVGDAAVYTVDEALGLLQQFMTRRVRQVPSYKGNLTLMPGELEIPINLFTKTSIQRLPSAKKHSPAEGLREGGAVERKLTYAEYQNRNEEGTSGREELIKAYRYGRSLVPFHKIDEAQMAFKTKKSFQVIGFLPESKIDRESFMSSVYAIVGEPGNAPAQKAISALARALYEKGSVALVRYVRAENGAPKLGILQPRIKSSYESLLFNILPFSEDHRRYLFSSFPVQLSASAEQDVAMKEWIEGMDLMGAARDEDGESMEALRPGDTFNVTFQAHYAAVQNRALHPAAPLLHPDPSLLRHLSTPESLLTNCLEAFERVKDLFPLRSNKKQQKLSEQVPRLWAAAAAKSVDDDDELPADKPARVLNPTDPLPDFRAMLADKHQDLVESALMQLMALIPKFVQDGNLDLAVECFKELRAAALKEDEFLLFNTFLVEYKRQAALHTPVLWARLQEANLTLIASTENAESPVDPMEAQAFISTNLN